MSNIMKPRRRRLMVLLCVILLFCSLLSSTAFAAGVTVSTAYSDAYFQTFSSKGTWVGIGTPKHYIVETGEVCYCVQTDKTEPTNAGYAEVAAESVFNTPAVLKGIQIILENGYPTTTGGFSDDEARYATANAIRFFLVDCGEPYVPAWMNLNLYSQFFRARSGYEDLWNWCLSLRNLANAQGSVGGSTYHAVSFSSGSVSLTEDGDYFIGTVSVSLAGCEGGYRLDNSSLPSGSSVTGYTGVSGDVLTIMIPTAYELQAFTLYATGIGYESSSDLQFYTPYNPNLQNVVTYVSGTIGELADVASTSVSISTPEVLVKTGSLLLRKTDSESGQPLAGVGYRVLDAGGAQIREGYTGPDGTLRFDDLELGSYTYKEFAAHTGYILDETAYSFTVTERGQVVEESRTNDRRKGEIYVHKRDAAGNALAGSSFTLESSYDGGVSWNVVQQLTTDGTGDISFANLQARAGILYRLTETATADGYGLQAGTIYCGALPCEYDAAAVSSSRFEIVGDKAYLYSLDFTVCNCPNLTMPFTGGSGYTGIILSSLMLFGMGVFIYLKQLRRKLHGKY